MKTIIFTIMVTMFSVLGINAQDARSSQRQNEFIVGFSAVQENVDRTYRNGTILRFDDSRKSAGFVVGYDHYFGGSEAARRAGILGLGAEFDATFNRNGVALATGVVNGTLKARNSRYVQPYVRLGAGFARADFSGSNVVNTPTGIFLRGFETSEVLKAGVGIDWNTKEYSKYKVRTGVNYETTTFGNDRQHNVRGTVALVF